MTPHCATAAPPRPTTGIFEGVLVLVDRPDSPESRADEQMLTDAGACVLPADELHLRLLDKHPDQFVSVLLLADASVASSLSRRWAAVLRSSVGAFCIVVGPGLDSAGRTSMLRAGADDCLDWPYVPDELSARIEALLRRQPRSRPSVLRSAGLHVDVRRRTVRLLDAPVEVTPREFDLLAHLLRYPDVVHTRGELLAAVWGYEFGGTETVTVHVRRLRAKIEPAPATPQRIVTVRGRGYLYASRVPTMLVTAAPRVAEPHHEQYLATALTTSAAAGGS